MPCSCVLTVSLLIILSRERRRKDDAVFEALGDVDELTVAIGVAREHCSQDSVCAVLVGRLTEIQSVMTALAIPPVHFHSC